MIPVTIVTRDAAAFETLTDQDYREIFGELRSKMTLRSFQDFIGSQRSFAWWSKYERGDAQLARADKNDLRRAVGLPELPLSVEEAITRIHPDAIVYRVGGAELAGRIIERTVTALDPTITTIAYAVREGATP